jgi:hypothetical protein
MLWQSMLYLISYDLNKEGKDYAKLYEAIKSNSGWISALKSAWIIYTKETVEQVYNKMRPTIDDDDYLFVSELNTNRQGWLRKDVWEWINKHQNL